MELVDPVTPLASTVAADEVDLILSIPLLRSSKQEAHDHLMDLYEDPTFTGSPDLGLAIGGTSAATQPPIANVPIQVGSADGVRNISAFLTNTTASSTSPPCAPGSADINRADPSAHISSGAIGRTRNNGCPSGDVLQFSGFMDLTNSVTIVGDEPLCGGGSCDVYVGELKWDASGAQTKVAMKQIRVFRDCTDSERAKSWKRFRREAKIWSKLKHPFILPFFGFARFGEFRLFLISPWAAKGNCLQYLGANPSASRPDIVSQVADALEYLHGGQDPAGYIHGDLKGDNVLISEGGDALLCDFGLARCVQEIASMTRTPSDTNAFGLLRFAAPELLFADRPTLQSDVFAFGCLVIQIFTGHQPYHDLPMNMQVMGAIIAGVKPGRPTEPSVVAAGLDDNVWEVVNQCLDHQATMRPGMAEVAQRLKRHQLHPNS
ncbi:hypothetical protein JAAARDRAFT_82247 [Jaapia argillacea MUCL 33604]|uniref:Protein kinase domain-containing protein n=1 Tax=Jaapia argillacea MUCL 33604 TaxID=933084 RepID=A0A067P617_9AGAM|nr:hypothetical protein JAAARDRAFT_82247 [Jaapia argillacea MUCL 33604]